MYQDMWPGNLEQAKTIIMEVFESFKEERVIANKLRQEFEKAFGKLKATHTHIYNLSLLF